MSAFEVDVADPVLNDKSSAESKEKFRFPKEIKDAKIAALKLKLEREDNRLAINAEKHAAAKEKKALAEAMAEASEKAHKLGKLINGRSKTRAVNRFKVCPP